MKKIKAENLKIGNYVDYENTSHIITGLTDTTCTSEWEKAEEEDPYVHSYNELKGTPLTRERVLELGFKAIPHFTIGNSCIYDLGRRRFLSISNIGTPNEMLFIKEMEYDNSKKVEGIVVLNNFDYDGLLTTHKLQNIISSLH